jgi:hypothetical protein
MGKRNERILKIFWSKKENDFMIQYPRRCDGSFIQFKFFHRQMIFDLIKYNTETIRNSNVLPYDKENDFIEELEKRGYDKKSMKFEIRLKDDVDLN